MNSEVNILICGNLGSKAINMFQKHDIQVFSGANGNIQEAFEEWMNG